jgi:6-phosphogluconolactonase
LCSRASAVLFPPWERTKAATGCFIGTYTKGKSRGIYSATLDLATGQLGLPELAAEAPNPTFLALSPDRRFLYAVCANAGWASSFRVDSDAFRLAAVQQAPAGTGPTPCHISVDATGRIALAANYHLGPRGRHPPERRRHHG